MTDVIQCKCGYKLPRFTDVGTVPEAAVKKITGLRITARCPTCDRKFVADIDLFYADEDKVN
jgi:hypothetical protein